MKYILLILLFFEFTFWNCYAQEKQPDFMTFYCLASANKENKIDTLSCLSKSTKDLAKLLNKETWNIKEIEALECMIDAAKTLPEKAFLKYILALAYSDFNFESKLEYFRYAYFDYNTLEDIEGQFYTLTRLFNSKMQSPDDHYSDDKINVKKSFEEINTLAKQSKALSVQLTLKESLIRKSFFVDEPLSEAELDEISKFAERHYLDYPTESMAVFTALGIAYQRAQLPKKALKHKRFALKNADSTSVDYYEHFSNMAGYHFYNKDMDSAFFYLQSSYRLIPKETSNLKYLTDSYIISLNLSRVLKRQKNNNLAFYYLDKSLDHLRYKSEIKLFNQRAFNEKQFEVQKKEQQIKDANLALQAEKKLQIYYITIIIFSLVFVFILYFQYKNTKKLKIKASLLAEKKETLLAKSKEEKRIIRDQAKRLKKIDSAKNNFFTNITHEFRTPLTVIKGVTQLIEKKDGNATKQELQNIKNNSESLLDMVNEILDLKKLESHELKLNLKQGDVKAYVDYLVDAHQYLAKLKSVALQFKCAEDEILMDFDRDKMKTILTNLISNALKYTDENGSVVVELEHVKEKNSISIHIIDDGIGLKGEDAEHVFELFHQAENSNLIREKGSGIGLYLTKQLVDLMDGTIEVKNSSQKGTTISVHLPIINTSNFLDETYSPHKTEQHAKEKEPSRLKGVRKDAAKILIVEDNASVRQLLGAQLSKYNLSYAHDGQSGIDKTIHENPDLVISDVMMPKKNGYELCAAVKSDVRTSHIPIILLTAKADQSSKLDGLKVKADDYLYKPFDLDELQLKVSNLLESRKKLQSTYKNFKEDSQPSPFPKEDQFILELRQLITDNLKNEEFGVEDFCKGLKISRSHLHNKTKSLTGMSITKFTNHIKIHLAKDILQSNNMNISEVAYEVGMTNVKYFSKLFKEEFGVSPSVYKVNDTN